MKKLFLGLGIFLTFLFLGIFLLFVSFKKEETKPALSADAQITQKLKTLYSTYDKYGKYDNRIYGHPIPKNLFSTDLEKKLKEVVDITNASVEKIKKSDHPTDKPHILEGSIFTSLYEGYTSYTIQSVVVNSTGTSADATVRLEHAMSQPKFIWTDKVHLVKSDQEWKIDNISFDSIGNSKDLKAILNDFIQNAK
ncbi:hypothetical protein [Chryseobacterium lathyri]|uniref:DUF3828 domain-containing protein n=1 Tax=Chryseobacterium lathyri TaxID=395933 RepID=A0ABT9SK75_9FLAO|nr:hypothetical protein [Chryseobacterium lathyri]MDP9959838.1 hypothetical protein [Chryseobacterium lathyri]MDQ0064606.1 hypothetical protein [Chryseobacterium lathyri]